MKKLATIFICLTLLGIGKVRSQEDPEPGLTRILIIFDASNSMNAKWENSSKIKVARKILVNVVDSLRHIDNLHLGLRIYGHQTKILPGQQDCDDTKLEVPFDDRNHDDIINKIKTVIPKGTTPIARSLEYSIEDFPDTNARNVIILITDGIEACDEDPCAVARALRAKGISVKPFVVGLGIDLEYLENFRCIGNFFDARTEGDFKTILGVVMSQALNNTTVTVNLLDTDKKPTETDVTMSFYDQNNGQLMHTWTHTLNEKDNPDTLTMDPLHTYKLVVHTIPEVGTEDIKLTPGKHTDIDVDAPQGYLKLETKGKSSVMVPCIVRLKDQMKTLNVQYFGEREKYITGDYDLEVLTLPRLYFDDVTIEQSQESKIEIPGQGTLFYEMTSAYVGQIFQRKDDENIWLANIKDGTYQGNVNLLPGEYVIVYRRKNSKVTVNTKEKVFRIFSGETTTVKL